MGLIYAQTAQDKALILGQRQALIYPFTAPNWTDLRLGLFLSLTDNVNNDSQAGLTESFAEATFADRFWIGFKNNGNDIIPANAGSSFIGAMGGNGSAAMGGSIKVDPSTGGTTTTGTTYWRAYNTVSLIQAVIWDGVTLLIHPQFLTGGLQVNGFYLPQNAGAAGGYSVLMIMRMTRATSIATSITVDNSGANVAYSSTPTIAAIRALLRTSTYTPSAAQPVTITPDAVYVYWPFFNSRLRIHALVLEKFA